MSTLSNKLDRIKSSVNHIRTAFGLESDVIEDVALGTESKLNELNSTVANQEVTISDLNITVANKDTEIQGLTDTVAIREATITDLSNQNAVKDATIIGLQETVSEQANTIAGHEETIYMKNQEIEALNARIAELEGGGTDEPSGEETLVTFNCYDETGNVFSNDYTVELHLVDPSTNETLHSFLFSDHPHQETLLQGVNYLVQVVSLTGPETYELAEPQLLYSTQSEIAVDLFFTKAGTINSGVQLEFYEEQRDDQGNVFYSPADLGQGVYEYSLTITEPTTGYGDTIIGTETPLQIPLAYGSYNFKINYLNKINQVEGYPDYALINDSVEGFVISEDAFWGLQFSVKRVNSSDEPSDEEITVYTLTGRVPENEVIPEGTILAIDLDKLDGWADASGIGTAEGLIQSSANDCQLLLPLVSTETSTTYGMVGDLEFPVYNKNTKQFEAPNSVFDIFSRTVYELEDGTPEYAIHLCLNQDKYQFISAGGRRALFIKLAQDTSFTYEAGFRTFMDSQAGDIFCYVDTTTNGDVYPMVSRFYDESTGDQIDGSQYSIGIEISDTSGNILGTWEASDWQVECPGFNNGTYIARLTKFEALNTGIPTFALPASQEVTIQNSSVDIYWRLQQGETPESGDVLPEGLVAAEYVENAGGTYFNTEEYIKEYTTFKVDASFSLTDAANSGEGYREGWLFGHWGNANFRLGIDGDGTAEGLTWSGIFGNGSYPNNCQEGQIVSGEYSSYFDAIEGGQSYLPLYLFNCSEVGRTESGASLDRQFIGRIYYLKIYNGNTLVKDFIPAYREADGVTGLYDKVTGVFYEPLTIPIDDPVINIPDTPIPTSVNYTAGEVVTDGTVIPADSKLILRKVNPEDELIISGLFDSLSLRYSETGSSLLPLIHTTDSEDEAFLLCTKYSEGGSAYLGARSTTDRLLVSANSTPDDFANGNAFTQYYVEISSKVYNTSSWTEETGTVYHDDIILTTTKELTVKYNELVKDALTNAGLLCYAVEVPTEEPETPAIVAGESIQDGVTIPAGTKLYLRNIPESENVIIPGLSNEYLSTFGNDTYTKMPLISVADSSESFILTVLNSYEDLLSVGVQAGDSITIDGASGPGSSQCYKFRLATNDILRNDDNYATDIYITLTKDVTPVFNWAYKDILIANKVVCYAGETTEEI